jgi:eukaryotic-like serine/threonine-protein kinase
MGTLLMAAAKKSPHSSAGTELHGELAGEYRILRKLGAGGFGTVYEAEHPLLKRRAAVKVLHAHPAVDSVAVQRFIEEARSASQIRHRHIVDIFSFGTLPNGQYFYVMDLLDGAPLDRYLAEHGRLTPEQAVPLLRPIASAIDALHAASLVHRDLKPGNIYLAWDSNQEVVPKLLDFGLVKLLAQKTPVHTDTGAPLGTPYYMAPEQCKGEKIDAAADIYSFGVICFELLTGAVPFKGDSATSVLVAHVLQEPPRPSEVCPGLAADLDEPLLRMLAKDPSARPPTAAEAVRELQLAAQGAGVTIGDNAPWLPRPTPVPPGADESFGVDPTVAQSGLRDGGSLSRRSKRRALRVWAVAPAILVLGILALQLFREEPVPDAAPAASASASASEAPLVAKPAPQPSAAPPPAVLELPAPVAIKLKGAPDGAEIWFGEQQLGVAPGPVLVPYGDQPVQLTVVVPGRGKRTLLVTPNVAAELTLPPEKPRSKRTLPRDLENPF